MANDNSIVLAGKSAPMLNSAVAHIQSSWDDIDQAAELLQVDATELGKYLDQIAAASPGQQFTSVSPILLPKIQKGKRDGN